jgi:hypothetical protein
MIKLDPTYRDAIVKSWHFTWHHKLLWVLSIVALLFTQFGLSNFLGQLWLMMSHDAGSLTTNMWSVQFWSLVRLPHGVEWLGVVWLLVILLSLISLITVVSVCAEGALIVAMCGWFKNRTVPQLKKIWYRGVKHFWRLFAVNALQKISLLLILYVIRVLLQLFSYSVIYSVFILSISFLVAILVSTFTIYVAGYIVEKEFSFKQSCVEAWELLSQHLLVSLELSIVLLALNFVLVAIVAGGSVLVLIPSFFIWIIGGATGYFSLFSVGFFLATILFLIFLALAGGLFNAFITGTWMYLFVKMNTKTIPSRVIHYMRKLVRS